MFVGKVPHNRWPRPKALVLNLIVNQRAKKVVSDSLGPVDFDIGLVIFVLNAPINVNPVGESAGKGRGCLRLSPCWAFDRAKRPRGRDI